MKLMSSSLDATQSKLTLLIPPDRLHARIAELADELSDNLGGDSESNPVQFLIVLRGAFLFGADLFRQFRGNAQVNFVHATSYQGTQSTSNLRLEGDLSFATGKTVLVVEDIIDTGRTLSALLEKLRKGNPARIEFVSLLHKDCERTRCALENLRVDRLGERLYLGFEIPDRFVVGYGLDFDQRYRNLDGIYTFE